MNIAIYQTNLDRDTNCIAFISYKDISLYQGSADIDSKVYDKVFEHDVDCQTLENVYQKFNLDLPMNYVGRTLSVSDIVEVKDSEVITPGFYFCDDFGFKKVKFDSSLCPKKKRGHHKHWSSTHGYSFLPFLF